MNDAVAVVLGMGPTALSIVRGLGRRGVKVYGIGLSRWEVALRSRYCTPLGAIDPRHEPERLCRRLIEFAEEHPDTTKVLYASGDECVAFIGEHHVELARHYSFSKLGPDTVELFLNKERFYRACVEHGVPAPFTLVPTSPDDLTAFIASGCFPCILKPKYYHKWAPKHGLTKVIYCQRATDLLAQGDSLGSRIADFVVQEVIPGPEEEIYVFAAYFDRSGQPHGAFVGQKIRQYPVGFGTTTAMRAASVPQIEEQSVGFLQKLGYQGLCDVEYKYDRRTNAFRIIEINPRIGRWYGIVEASGHDTVYCSFLDLSGVSLPPLPTSKTRPMTWVFASRDFLSLAASKRFALVEVLRSYGGPVTWCIWARDDVKPFFAYIGEMATKGLGALRKYV
ncbi:MAG TPA: hypothetical protein VM238_03255 [Phycisphaerae bacterium]|nr:hypothetical protein [Phycisphaerae bacterium]HUU90210.1 hypothetical protein [Phycisphaerae bacterium]